MNIFGPVYFVSEKLKIKLQKRPKIANFTVGPTYVYIYVYINTIVSMVWCESPCVGGRGLVHGSKRDMRRTDTNMKITTAVEH